MACPHLPALNFSLPGLSGSQVLHFCPCLLLIPLQAQFLITAHLFPACMGFFATPWTAAPQASLSFTISRILLKLISINSVMLSSHLILCCPLLLPSIFFSIRVFSNESTLHLGSPQVVLVIKYLPANAGDVRDTGLIPESGRFPGEGNGNPLQYSCLENPMDRETLWATVHGITWSQT